MKKLVRIVFEYDDKTAEQIIDPTVAALFQSRCNSLGLLTGLYNFIEPIDISDEDEITPAV